MRNTYERLGMGDFKKRSFIKFYQLSHFPRFVRQVGSPLLGDTSGNEAKHKESKRLPHRTNNKNVGEIIATHAFNHQLVGITDEPAAKKQYSTRVRAPDERAHNPTHPLAHSPTHDYNRRRQMLVKRARLRFNPSQHVNSI